MTASEARPRAAAAPLPAGPFRAARDEAAGLVVSFNYAFEGVIYVVRTQRNMRVHFAGRAWACWSLGVVLGVTRFELLALMLAVSFVLIAEMINTAIEKAIDVATNSFDPRGPGRQGRVRRRGADRGRERRC